MKVRGETADFAAPKEQAKTSESLRQKYFYWTQLWRESALDRQRGNFSNFKGSSQAKRTEA